MGKEEKEDNDCLRHGGKGSSKLNRHRAHKGFLRGGVFPGWQLAKFQSLSLEKLGDSLDFELRDWFVFLCSGIGWFFY